ncbi:ATP dependent DNA ligase [Marasmius fiardii PR-910]|nr:ATP dependent DNA ligase [Marasmius fiardii PR-910]
MASLSKSRGFIGLVGDHIDALASTASQNSRLEARILDAKSPFHITIITKDELRNGNIPETSLQLNQPVDTSRIFLAGVGGNARKGVYFGVVIWAAGQQIRKRLGLGPKNFHITLTTTDDHEMDKGIDSLIHGQFPEGPSREFLDHLGFTLQLFSQYKKSQMYSILLVRSDPNSDRGYLRLADAAYSNEELKLALLSYACAYDRSEDEKVRSYCTKRLIACSKHTEWGCLFQESEMNQLTDDIASILTTSWSEDLRSYLSFNAPVPTLSLDPRDRLYLPLGIPRLTFSKLPRFFRWMIPYHLAVMSTPRNEEDIALLSHIGIRRVLTLTEETPLPEAWFTKNPNISNTFLPVRNYHPPSIEQMDIIMQLMEDVSNLPLLVHCGGGKGRAGTVVACYIAAFGFNKPSPGHVQDHPEMSAGEAVETIRRLRPGSIETSQQEDFVAKWCKTIWKRQSVYPDMPSEPPPCPVEIEGQLVTKNADLFILVGLPGSGKSWFSRSLLARDPKFWIRISQDDSGSRVSCETQIGYTPKSGQRVLLDRCNTSLADRKQWLLLASNWCKNPVCVLFDYDREICEARAQRRVGHPTLIPGSRVRNAVEQMHKGFVKPTLSEGFKAVVVVRSFEAAKELVGRLVPPINIYKFPRTEHILNLGAVTEDDLVSDLNSMAILPQADERTRFVITEKVDGANMGFSLSASSQIIVQNRSHYVNSSTHEQFRKLGLWVDRHRDALFRILNRDELYPERYILFGEWLYATHSIPYTSLPDLFMAFDLYDRSTDTFVDRPTLVGLLDGTGIQIVPVIYEGEAIPSQEELKGMVQRQSKFWDGRVEGVYVKVERDGKVIRRGKLVRGDFIAGNEHWSRGQLGMNGLMDRHAVE